MTIPKVAQSIGTSFPGTPDELVAFVARVLGKYAQEQRERWNHLEVDMGFLIFPTVADLEAFDSTDVLDAAIAVVSDDREMFTLDKTGTPVAGIDPAALGGGSWNLVLGL